MKKKFISLALTIIILATCISANASYVKDCGKIMQETNSLMVGVENMSESNSLERLNQISKNLDTVVSRMSSENYDVKLTYTLAASIKANYGNLATKFEKVYGSNSKHVTLAKKITKDAETIATKANYYLKNYPLNFDWSGIQKRFTDIPSNAWYYSDVAKTSAANIISGKDDTHFDPNGTLTHAEAMTLMAKVHAIHHTGYPGEIFNYSFSGNHWAGSIREYCKDNKLPYPSDKELDTPISREKMGLYFRKALPDSCYNTPGFENVITNASKFKEIKSYPHIQDLYKSGIIVGDENGFRLQDSITRAEAAAIIHRVADIYVRVDVASR